MVFKRFLDSLKLSHQILSLNPKSNNIFDLNLSKKQSFPKALFFGIARTSTKFQLGYLGPENISAKKNYYKLEETMYRVRCDFANKK